MIRYIFKRVAWLFWSRAWRQGAGMDPAPACRGWGATQPTRAQFCLAGAKPAPLRENSQDSLPAKVCGGDPLIDVTDHW